MLPLFARSFAIGLAVAAPVGAMGVLCIQRVLARGFRAGLATGLGIATADGLYAGMAAFGVAAVASALVAWRVPLQVVGGVALVVMGIRAFRAEAAAACAAPAAEQVEAEQGALALYASAVGLTLTNPMTIMAFAAVFASVGLSAAPDAASAAVATAGVACGSLAWWVGLSAVFSVVRRMASPRPLMLVGRVSAAVLVIFGVSTLLRAF